MAKGDLFVRNAAGSFELLTVGSDGNYLKADSAQTLGFTWGAPSGSGDVTGPASSTDHMIAVFNGTSGKAIETIAVPTSATQYLKCASTGPPVTYEWAAPSASVTLYPGPDYFFYREGSTYYALNTHTGAIDYSGSACHTVLQSTINNLISSYNHGVIFFRSSDTFVFTSGVSHTFNGGAGCYLLSNGAHLDLSGLNSTLIDFGSDTEWLTVTNGKAKLTGMAGFTIYGDSSYTNTSCKIATFRNMSRVCYCEKITASYVANGFELRGGMYNATFRDVKLTYLTGTGWKCYGLDPASYGSPDEFILDHCMVANGTAAALASSIAVDVDGGASYHADGWWIVDSWFENTNKGIIASGSGGKIVSSIIVPDQGTTPKAIILTAGSETNGIENLLIQGNEILASPSTGFGIHNDATIGVAGKPIKVENNNFHGEGTAIYGGISGGIFQINNNRFQAADNSFIAIAGTFAHSTLSGNQFLQQYTSTPQGPIQFSGGSDIVITDNSFYLYSTVSQAIASSGSIGYCIISSNIFEWFSGTATNGINLNNFSNAVVIGNNFDGVTNQIINPGTNYIRDNRGYATSYSVLGPSSATEHALAIFDGTTGKIIESIAVPTATNQYLKCASTGPPVTYEWATVSGSGDVLGPSTSTDHSVARFNGTDNKTIQGSGVIIDDSNNVSGIGTLASGTHTVTGDVVPEADNTRSLGSATYGWGHLYLGAATTYKIHAGGTVDFRDMADSAYRGVRVNSLTIGSGSTGFDSSGNCIAYGVNVGSGTVFPATDLASSVGKSTQRFPHIYMGHATAPTIRSDTEFRFRNIADSAYQLIDVLSLKVGGTSVIDSSRNMANVGTLGCGAITSSGALGLGANAITCGGITHSADIVPSADNVRSLGDATHGYLNIYMSAAGASKIRGTSSISFRNIGDTVSIPIYCSTVNCTGLSYTGGATASLTGSIDPTADATYTLGTSTNGYARLYLGGATTAKIQAGTTIAHRNMADSADQAITCGGITFSADIVPTTDANRALGDSTHGMTAIFFPAAASGTLRCGAAVKVRTINDGAYQALDCLSLSIGGSTVINSSGIITNQVVSINFVIDGGGAAITTGAKGFIEVPFAMTVTGWTIVADQSGSIVVDVHRSTYSGFPTTSSIAGSELPTLSSAQKNQDLTLTTWTTSLAAGDILDFQVDGTPTSVQRVTVSIRGTRA